MYSPGMTNRLISLAFSHYNEKARWALDICGIPYVEEKYMPGFSSLAVMRATAFRGGSDDRVSTKYSTPLLLLSDGTKLHDSADICRYASEKGGNDLYPSPEVEELERYFHDRIGPNTRRVAYGFAFEDPQILARMADDNVSARQARWFKRLYPLVVRRLRGGLGLDPERIEKSQGHVRAEFDALAERLGEREFLCGGTFTAADLTWASMVVPAILVTREEGFGASMPTLDEIPEEAVQLVGELRGHPAGQFALRMYREHRIENSKIKPRI